MPKMFLIQKCIWGLGVITVYIYGTFDKLLIKLCQWYLTIKKPNVYIQNY